MPKRNPLVSVHILVKFFMIARSIRRSDISYADDVVWPSTNGVFDGISSIFTTSILMPQRFEVVEVLSDNWAVKKLVLVVFIMRQISGIDVWRHSSPGLATVKFWPMICFS